MPQSREYKTRQRGLILDCLVQNRGGHITADDVTRYLKEQGAPVGRTTVYRYLEKLVAEGVVQKFSAGPGGSACFQYNGCGGEHNHFHLKCVDCGKLIHLDCDHFLEVERHILKEHGFSIDNCRTVLYGHCEDCAKKQGEPT